MQNQLMNQWSEISKRTMESGKKLVEINNEFVQNVAQQQMEAATAYMESTSKHLQSLTEAKRPQDVFAAQSQFLQELNKTMLGLARNSMDMMVDAKNQWTHWFEEGAKEMGELVPAIPSVKK